MQAVLLAGFRAEEVVMVRVLLDAAGAADVKVVPVFAAALHRPTEAALDMPEPDWGAPRPEGWGAGGGWGSQRTLLTAGLPCARDTPAVARPGTLLAVYL